jgi:hypothetical protein
VSLFTDIRELANSARQAANDVAGTVVDVRNTGNAIRGTAATREAQTAQARAQVATWNPTESGQIQAGTGTMMVGGVKLSPVMLIGAAAVLFLMLRGR